MKNLLKSLLKTLPATLLRHLRAWLKFAVFAPEIVFVHLARMVLGLYHIAAQTLLGRHVEADILLDELSNIDL